MPQFPHVPTGNGAQNRGCAVAPQHPLAGGGGTPVRAMGRDCDPSQPSAEPHTDPTEPTLVQPMVSGAAMGAQREGEGGQWGGGGVMGKNREKKRKQEKKGNEIRKEEGKNKTGVGEGERMGRNQEKQGNVRNDGNGGIKDEQKGGERKNKGGGKKNKKGIKAKENKGNEKRKMQPRAMPQSIPQEIPRRSAAPRPHRRVPVAARFPLPGHAPALPLVRQGFGYTPRVPIGPPLGGHAPPVGSGSPASLRPGRSRWAGSKDGGVARGRQPMRNERAGRRGGRWRAGPSMGGAVATGTGAPRPGPRGIDTEIAGWERAGLGAGSRSGEASTGRQQPLLAPPRSESSTPGSGSLPQRTSAGWERRGAGREAAALSAAGRPRMRAVTCGTLPPHRHEAG